VIIISLLLMNQVFRMGSAARFALGQRSWPFALYLYRSARRSGGGTVCQRWCGTYSDADSHRHAAGIRFSKGTTLAFVMAAGFIADTASLPLIVSNLVNIVSADFFGLGFTEYASVMVPVDIAAIIATLVMLHLFFRKDIPPTYDLALLKAPAKAIKDLATSEPAG
jgi:hypothetical protein